MVTVAVFSGVNSVVVLEDGVDLGVGLAEIEADLGAGGNERYYSIIIINFLLFFVLW